MMKIILLVMLGMYTIEDIRKKTISIAFLPVFGLAGAGLHLFQRDIGIVSILMGVVVGAGMIGISFLTRESIGLGDGFIFLVTGVFLGGADNMELLLFSLLYAAVFSLGVLIVRKKKRKQEIPFIPFVFLGYLTMIVEAGL